MESLIGLISTDPEWHFLYKVQRFCQMVSEETSISLARNFQIVLLNNEEENTIDNVLVDEC